MENLENSTTSYNIQFSGDISFVPPLRKFISEVALAKGYSSRDSYRIETIVDEIVNNAIEHGDGLPPEISLETQINRRRFALTVRNRTAPDQSSRFKNVIESSRRPLRIDARRGQGLALVKLISDSLEVSFDGAGTKVTITTSPEEG